MTTSTRQHLDSFISYFQPISLAELNTKARMLERLENKYILSREDLYTSLDALLEEFDILEIDGLRDFTYETIYFDSTDHICYTDHHRNKRLRFKVRTRKYIDADTSYLEMKLESRGNRLIKKRYNCGNIYHGIMTDEAKIFVQKEYLHHYKKEFPYSLVPSLMMSYQRITLVAKVGGERLTIDHDIHMSRADGSQSNAVPSDCIIIEVKSRHGHGIADAIFRRHNRRPLPCSKFCLGTIMNGHAHRVNLFLPILKKYFPDTLKRITASHGT